MANSIEKAKVYQQQLDEQMTPLLMTGWMEDNAGAVRYQGGSEIKIPKLSMTGLGNYSRSSGYPAGSVTLAYETMTMSMDRAISFDLDRMDVEESGLDALAGLIMGNYQRDHVAPEIDAYRISKLYTLAGTAGRTTATITKSNAFSTLKENLATVQDKVGEGVPLVVMMPFGVAALLDQDASFTRSVTMETFKSGKIETRVRYIDGIPILRMPSGRMKTAYTFHTGVEASGTTKHGFEAATGALNINWIILPRSAPIAVSKADTIRIFDPETWQSANAWHIDYRRYHDLWVPDNKLAGLLVNHVAPASES